MMSYKYLLFVFLIAIFVIALPISASAQGLEQLAKGSHKAPVSVRDTVGDDVKPQTPYQSYVLDADDVINVTVYGEPDLSKAYRIGSAGTISFPLIGEIGVRGQTTRQVEKVLYDKLSDGYLVNPSISVEVTTYRPFYILGEVRQPGSYAYLSGATVLKAVALAGGFTYRANKKQVQILKTKNNEAGLYDKVSVDSPIGPGDIILVKERFF